MQCLDLELRNALATLFSWKIDYGPADDFAFNAAFRAII